MTSMFRLSLGLALLAAACAPKATPASTNRLSPSDYYPLGAGNAWAYDVDTGEDSTTLGVTKVESFDGRVAVVRTGRTVLRYEVLEDGIRVLADEAWVLRAPLEVGASWRGRGGRSARIVSTDAPVETRAGNFDRCVEVLETGGKLELEVRTIYCPRVGPVLVESTMRSEASERSLAVSARLRGYEVSVFAASNP